MNQTKSISVIIAAYNEEIAIKEVIFGLKNELDNLNVNYEIIVVNDASTDKTLEILNVIPNIRIINQPYNKGKGAAQKLGAQLAQHDWLLFFDADGQHNPLYLKEMLKYTTDFDLVTGERSGYQGPWQRQPGKKVIHWLAWYLLNQKIRDFNCGLRLVRKKEFLRFAHILPNGFSCDTTTIFTFLKEKLNIKFVPIEINKREGGKSLVKPHEAITYFMLIIRLIMLLSPLRVFFPVSVFLFLIGFAYLIYDLTVMNISEGTIFVLLTSLLIFFFGLIADQIAALRREINKK